MRILGIDPGIGRTGWGIIEEEGGKIKAIAFDCFQTPAGEAIPIRLEKIYTHIQSILRQYKPHALAIEDLFFNTNAKTALVVGQARGVVILATAQANVPLAIYTPLQVKIAVAGYGRAEKTQIGHMIKAILKMPSVPKPDDTADALAIALTHAFSKKTRDL